MTSRIVLALAILGVVPYLWLASASALYCQLIGHTELWQFPYDQWLTAAPWWRQNGLMMILVPFSATAPAALVGLVWFAIWRRRRGNLTPPFGGGLRPLQPGVTDNHGHARILTDKECLRRFPGPNGIVIGELRRGKAGRSSLVIDPIVDGAGHCMIVAGTRGGKSMSAATGILYWVGSAGVLDPSAELGAMLKLALESDGKKVHLLNPGTPNSGFNALAWINPNKPLAGADVKSMVNWLFPDDNANVNKDGYFEPSGKALCIAVLADLIWANRPPEEKTLRTFRGLVTTPENLMPRLLETIHARSHSLLARDIAGTLMKVTPKQFSGIYGQAVQGTDWLADPDLADLVSGDAFKVSDILDGHTFVFAQIPLRALKQSPGVGRVIIGSLMSAVYEGGREADGRVLMCLDEAHALGRMAIMEDALVVGGKSGLTISLYYQSVGQAKKIWGEDGITTLYNNLSWRGYASIRDEATAEMVSKEFGEISVMATTVGENKGVSRPAFAGWGSRNFGDTINTHEMKRRLIMAQELKAADTDELFVISAWGNMRLRMPLYFRRPDLMAIVQPSHFVAAAD